jgi:hypothetical protein
MRTAITTTVAVVALLVTAVSASAATKPTATTGSHSALQPSSVTLLGKVNPQGSATTYFFQYGTSKAYGTQTGPVAAGSGTTTVNASTAIVGLTPHTGYHFRLVAVNAAGTTLGLDATFTTPKQPLGLSLLANPNPLLAGASTTVTATLTGTDNANRTIILQSRAFPYTAPFAQVGNAVITTSTGTAAFPILSLGVNTQFQAFVKGANPATVAPVVTVDAAVGVHLNLRSHHVRSGSLTTFSGTVSPAEDGAQYAIQKLKGTQWVNVAGSSLRHSSTAASKFKIRVRMKHSGVFRVFVGVADGAHASNSSGLVHLTVIPKHHR